MQQFVGQDVIVLNGVVIGRIKSFSADTQKNRKTVQGMTPTGDPSGWVEGGSQYSLSVEIYLPTGPDPVDWDGLTNALIYRKPRSGASHSYIFGGVATDRVRDRSDDGNGPRTISLDMIAMTKTRVS